MNNLFYIFIGSLALLIGFAGSCNKKDSTIGDQMPPEPPILIAASGAVTDLTKLDSEREAGIDAVPGENWIELQWEPPTRNANGSSLEDLSGYKIYRGVHVDTLNSVVLGTLPIDIIEEPLRESYVDESNLSIGTTYFYSISAYDERNNESAFSDTVSFRLVKKPIPTSPTDNYIISAGEHFYFDWDSNSLDAHYVKVFKSTLGDTLLIWKSKDFYDYEDFRTSYNENGIARSGYDTLAVGDYKWRVDIYRMEDGIPKGAESREISFSVQQ